MKLSDNFMYISYQKSFIDYLEKFNKVAKINLQNFDDVTIIDLPEIANSENNNLSEQQTINYKYNSLSVIDDESSYIWRYCLVI